MSKKEKTVEALKSVLADSYSLYLKTQNYHWNVKGHMFHSLHEMFEEQYTELAAAIDEIAERIRSLGSVAPGTFEEYQKLTSIKSAQYSLSAEDMVSDLLSDHERMVATLTVAMKAAESEEDEVTVDMAVERCAAHEKNAWMLRSVLER